LIICAPDSDSVNLGSNPGPPANLFKVLLVSAQLN
jgi:hypothetical protein